MPPPAVPVARRVFISSVELLHLPAELLRLLQQGAEVGQAL